MMSLNSSDFAQSALDSFSSPGSSTSRVCIPMATCIAVGKVSFDDCPMFTWSFGWTGFFEPITPPSISIARFEITSFAFMFDWVPDPVCQTTSGKLSSNLPAITSAAAATMALPSVGVKIALRHVHQRAGLLDDAKRADDRDRLAFPADGEVDDRPLGLRAPILVGRNLQRAKAVGLGTGRGHRCLLSKRSLRPIAPGAREINSACNGIPKSGPTITPGGSGRRWPGAGWPRSCGPCSPSAPAPRWSRAAGAGAGRR